ncbi:hypothetical protein ACTHQ8_09170 [Lysinibacillus odysseyi]|uniref:hypothetical protein n=1 Tax=Lysinibacillus odysseyi TaxID=202611 RepID=UPI000A53245B|nr:hypothetical protein [Lysinibacillus odysseyi]
MEGREAYRLHIATVNGPAQASFQQQKSLAALKYNLALFHYKYYKVVVNRYGNVK